MIAAPLRVSAPNGALVGFRPPSTSRTTRIRCFAAPTASGRGATTSTTLYEELGLRAGATLREIKAAYRRLARERHPDVAGEPAADDFVRLHHAYATLSDPDTRARYDRGAVTTMRAVAASGGWSGAGRPRRTWETDQCW